MLIKKIYNLEKISPQHYNRSYTFLHILVAKRHNITVKTEVYDIIAKFYNKEKSDKSFTQWISEKLIMIMEKDEFLKFYAPHLKKIAIQDSSVILRDDELKRLIEVVYRDNKFWCDIDKKECCIHIQFVLALPDIVKFKMK